MKDLVSEAIQFAVRAHDGMRRKKGDIPYILHPLEAAVIVSTMTNDQNLIAAAVLHDVVEDAGITFSELEETFSKRVADLVASETENKHTELPPSASWRMRKEESLKVLKHANDEAILIVWLGDKLANMRSIYRDWKTEGDMMWQSFHQKDPKEQAWYYKTIAVLTARLSEYTAWKEYKTLTELVFGKGE